MPDKQRSYPTELVFAPPPLDGETIMSWIWRLGEANGYYGDYDWPTQILIDILPTLSWLPREPLPRLLPDQLIQRLSEVSGTTEQKIRALMPSDPMTLRCRHHQIFCLECWREDAEKDRKKVYDRLSWYHRFSFICPKHNRPYEDFPIKKKWGRFLCREITSRELIDCLTDQSEFALMRNKRFLRLEKQLRKLPTRSDGAPEIIDIFDVVGTAIYRNFSNDERGKSAGEELYARPQLDPIFDDRFLTIANLDYDYPFYCPSPTRPFSFLRIFPVGDRRFFLHYTLQILRCWAQEPNPYQKYFHEEAWNWMMQRSRRWPQYYWDQLKPLMRTVASLHFADDVPRRGYRSWPDGHS